MPPNFGHLAAKELLKEVADLFRNKQIFFSLHNHVVFVCGGNHQRSLRNSFIKYAKNNHKEFRVFRAEDAVKDLLFHNNPEFVDVGEFEGLIASVFDSILIFPEGPGSIAELGFFSQNEVIRKKTLVVNWLEYQVDSFINLGPVTLIDKDSIFRPTIYLGNKKNPEFKLVVDRLLKYPKSRREAFKYQNYPKLSQRERLIVTFEIIFICKAIEIDNLAFLISYVFWSVDKNELKRLVSILCAADYVRRDVLNDQYLLPNVAVPHFLEYEHFVTDAITAKILFFYSKYDSISSEVFRRNAK